MLTKDARVVCPSCKDTQLDIVGINSPFTGEVDREAPGVVTSCDQMFCVECWIVYEHDARQQEMEAADYDDENSDEEDKYYICPTCRAYLIFPDCHCFIDINMIPTPFNYEWLVKENGPTSLASFL